MLIGYELIQIKRFGQKPNDGFKDVMMKQTFDILLSMDILRLIAKGRGYFAFLGSKKPMQCLSLMLNYYYKIV